MGGQAVMCFEVNAVPPELPPHLSAQLMSSSGTNSGAGTSAGQRITLTCADGPELAAYVARPAAPTGAGIVILPDVRGLFHFYEELAQRFAAAGVEAIAIDYFGRTAGMAPRPDDFDFMAHVAQVKLDQVMQDVAAAVAYVRRMPGAGTLRRRGPGHPGRERPTVRPGARRRGHRARARHLPWRAAQLLRPHLSAVSGRVCGCLAAYAEFH